MLENFFVQFWWPKFVQVAAEAGAALHCAHCWWSHVFKPAFQFALLLLSADRFGSPLGKLQGLFIFQFSRDPCFLLCLTGPGEELGGLCSLVITKGHGCFCWSLDYSGVIATAQFFELMLQISEEFTLNMEKSGLKINIRNNEFKDFFGFPSV